MQNNKSKKIIDNYISNKYKTLNSISLFSGLGSQILSKIEFHRYFPSDIKSSLETDIDHLFYLIENIDTFNATFSNGLSGAAWLILYLNEQDLININPDLFLEEIDSFIIEQLDIYLRYQNYDILHGSLGIGIYLIKRGRIDCVIRIINLLYSTAIKDDGEIKWKNIFPRTQNEDSYDLSLAHGHAGVLYFLGICYKKNINIDVCKIMIDGVFKFYFNNIQNQIVSGSFWPSKINVEAHDNNLVKSELSRLAWCYGDLGILQVMNLVSIWIDNTYLEETTEKLLEITAERRNIKDNLIDNIYMCHGISGIISIYSIIYHRKKNSIFKVAAEFWQEELTKLYDTRNDCFKKLCKIEPPILPENGILHGREGIILSLILLRKNEICPIWAQAFFMA